jgi:hypothetical protein
MLSVIDQSLLLTDPQWLDVCIGLIGLAVALLGLYMHWRRRV